MAVGLVAGTGWLAWTLLNPGATTASGAPATGGPAAPGGPGGRPGRISSTVGVATAERADIPVILEALGTVVPQATVRVRPQVSGVLQQLLFKEGQMVRKGELLAVIDPRQFEMALQQVIGQRQRDEASLAAAGVTLQRYRTLLQQDSIARQEVDTQEALVKQLEAAVVIARANEAVARLNLGYTRVVSPIAGRVGLRVVDVGNVVSSGDANGVALVTQVSPIDVEFSVPQDMAPSLQQAVPGSMKVQALDRTRAVVIEAGAFGSLDNVADTQTGTVRAKARFANAKLAMFPNQFVNVRLELRTVEGAVVVPVAAIRTGTTGDYVFVLNQDRTVSIRPIKRGQATVDAIQIAAGLAVGERVITEGADRLKEGSRVTLAGDPAGPGTRPGARRRGASAPVGSASGAAATGTAAEPVQRRAGGARPAGADSAAAQSTTGAPAAPPAAGKPTAEQRQRFLDQVKDNPEQLERRKSFLANIDAGDPQALERWQQMAERRRSGAPGGTAPAQ